MANPDLDHIDEQLRDDVRALAKDARAAEVTNWSELSAWLAAQNDQTLVTIARAFNQFLNLANIAEQAHVARQPDTGLTRPADESVASAVAELPVELVLTAHPTEVLRRTMIQKYDAIETALGRDAAQKHTELQRLNFRQLNVDAPFFSLNAAVCCRSHQRAKLERLCRYVARPPLALERLSLTDVGKLLYALKQPYSNGTTHFLFEPLDLLAKLAALVPRPRFNLVRYHGVFAPNSKLRGRIVPAASLAD